MAVLETTATRRKIVKELQRNKIGFTARELSEDLKIKVQTISATLQQMALSGMVKHGEFVECEGQIWEVTELGIAEYGVKIEVKNNVQESALEQIENEPTETIEAAPIVAESVLEQIEEPVVKESLTTETEETVAFKHEMTTESFKIWQIVDEAGAKFKQLLESKQAKPIDNIDYKIATLESLADIYNTKISTTLREIAADLRG